MREIKFRIWDKSQKKFLDYPCYFNSKDFNEFTAFDRYFKCDEDGCIVQQFTGVKDKNGKEIYEGDIVFFDDHEIASKPYIGRAEVFWCDDLTLCNSPQWALWAIGEKSGYYGYLIGEIEVIGNIFENPDLLK